MKKSFIFITFIFLTYLTSSFAQADDRRQNLIKVIDQELREVTRLNKQTRGKRPGLMVRMAELLLEKARLLKDIENEKYLSLSSKKRQRVRKSSYFKASSAYFKRAQRTCFNILKRFKRFKGMGDVYYILAYNAKEFSDSKKAVSYFQKAIKFSGKKSNTRTKSLLALGEIYFNKGNYGKVIPLYEAAFRGSKDQWYTKDLYNLAWSYFKVGKSSLAIRKMKEVFSLSKSGKYVDVSSDAERDLTYFYAETGQTKNAISFYKKSSTDVAKNLIIMGGNLKSKGKFTSAEKSYLEALRFTKSEGDKIKIHIELLGLYEKFGKNSKHFTSSNFLFERYKENKLNDEQKDILIYHLEKMSSTLQKQVSSKAYLRRKKIRSAKANLAKDYFLILAQVKSSKDNRYNFLAAETLYAAADYNGAIALYSKSKDISEQKKDGKFYKLSVEGMLSCLGKSKLSKVNRDQFLAPVYLDFLKFEKSRTKRKKIMERLFTHYYDKGDITNAEKVFTQYRKEYPRNLKSSEAMVANIMDYYQKKNDKASVKKWALLIAKGDIRTSKKYYAKVKALLLTLQFETVEKATTDGDKKRALVGYTSIYKDPSSTGDAKKNAAYNISVLFYELGYAEISYKWAMRAISEMTTKEILNFEKDFMTIAGELFNQQYFPESARLYEYLLKKLCKKRTKNKLVFYKNASVIYLSMDDDKNAKDIMVFGNSCRIPNNVKRESYIELAHFYHQKNDFVNLEKSLDLLAKYTKTMATHLEFYGSLLSHYESKNNRRKVASLERKVRKYFINAQKRRVELPLESLDVVASIKLKELKQLERRLFTQTLRFPEATFNKLLESKFKLLDTITSTGINIASLGSGKGIVETYRILIRTYEKIYSNIVNFTPGNKTPEYIASFKKSMQDLAGPLAQKKIEMEQIVKKQIIENDIFSKHNVEILNMNNLKFNVQYNPARTGVLMDRGGLK